MTRPNSEGNLPSVTIPGENHEGLDWGSTLEITPSRSGQHVILGIDGGYVGAYEEITLSVEMVSALIVALEVTAGLGDEQPKGGDIDPDY